MTVSQHDLLFGVRRSVRYHMRRRMFHERFNLMVNAVSVIMGSATVYGVLTASGRYVALTAATVVTVLSAINLVVGSTRQARLHADLAKRFIELEKRMVTAGALGEEALTGFVAERLAIEADEPPVLHVLNAICHNELARAMGCDPGHFARIAWYQRWLAPVMDVREHAITLHG